MGARIDGWFERRAERAMARAHRAQAKEERLRVALASEREPDARKVFEHELQDFLVVWWLAVHAVWRQLACRF